MTRNMLNFRRSGRNIRPVFADDDPAFLAACSTLLSIYQAALKNGSSRSLLEDTLEPMLKNPVQKAVPALNKLISDHSQFAPVAATANAAAERELIFKTAAAILQDPPENPEHYQRKVMALLKDKITLSGDIYSDLPEFDRLIAVPQWSAEELRNIYNVSQVQGLLLYADKLEITVSDAEPMALRKFMRRLKFFRLLASVERSSASEVKLTVSGPAAIFGENRKYGLLLAAFFQVVLLMKNWKIRAELKLRGDGVAEVLNLSGSKCNLSGNARRWAACLPDDVALFIKTFRREAEEWSEAAEAELPRIANCGAFFPDFSFARKVHPERVIHVELFHRYYFSDLEKRLEFLQNNCNFPLVLGADRSLLDEEQRNALLEKYPAGAEHLFFYSNYPGVERLRKMLERVYAICWGLQE